MRLMLAAVKQDNIDEKKGKYRKSSIIIFDL